MVEFRKVRTRRLYESVVEQFLGLISEGKIRLGQRLPTERELAVSMGVSRGVLREAFRVLEARGLIESRQGGGRFLRALPGSSGDANISLQLEQVAFLDYWEVREALECRAARLAALHASVAARQSLVAFAEELVEERKSVGVSVERDMAFHRKIADTSGNVLLSRLICELLDAVDGMRARLIEKISETKVPYDFLEDHIDIATAIQMGEPDLAEKLVRQHLSVARRKYADLSHRLEVPGTASSSVAALK